MSRVSRPLAPCASFILPAAAGLETPQARRMILSIMRAMFYRSVVGDLLLFRSTVDRSLICNLIETNMQSKKVVQIVVWIIVVGMVLGLVAAALSFL